jgi:hypothetical protein
VTNTDYAEFKKKHPELTKVLDELDKEDLLLFGDELEFVTKERKRDADWRDLYKRTLRNLVRLAWRGDLTKREFERMLAEQVNTGLATAWIRGLQRTGLIEEEADDDDKAVLKNELNHATTSLPGFSQFVFDNRKVDEAKFASLMPRTEIWINRWNATFNKTVLVAGENTKKKWKWNPAKDHCEDCREYNGKVFRKSVWLKYGIWPQSPALACNGWACGCGWTDTKLPVTPGRPKAPAHMERVI